MVTKYRDFSEVEQNGQTYIIAQPSNETEEPVRLDGVLTETEDADAEWTDVVSQLIQFDISGALNLESGQGKMAREQAVSALLNSEDRTIDIESRAQAEAIVDYFVSEDIIEEDGSDIVVLEDPELLQNLGSDEEENTNTKMLLNWVSAITGCTTQIKETIDTIERTQEELQEEIGESNVTEKVQNFEDKQEEVAQQLMNLTNGGTLDRSDLDPEAQAEYDRLEDRLFHLETMKEAVQGGDLEEELRRTAEDLGYQMERLRDLNDVLQEQKRKVKQAYQYKEEIAPEEAMQMAQNLANIATSLTNVPTTEERKEDRDTMALANQILESTQEMEVEGAESEESRSEELEQR